MEDAKSHQVRMAAFEWLKLQVALYGDVLPYHLLKNGFIFENEIVVLIGAKGIWKPKQIAEYPISLMSSIKSKYLDEHNDSRTKIHYKYRDGGSSISDNKRLRKAFQNKVPLIYLHQVHKGYYLVHYPVFIVADNPIDNFVTLEAELNNYLEKAPKTAIASDISVEYSQRKYATREVLQRIHQREFREKVLHAYHDHCAICRLKHRELLDAAHIIPDSLGGEPTVENGLSLCKIHHAAFDNNLIAITPDYSVKVRPDLLTEMDGPMLEHGIKAMHNQKLYLPHSIKMRPNKEWLDWRYKKYINLSCIT